MNTTIKLQDSTKARLDKLKVIPNESYNNILVRLLDNADFQNDFSLGEYLTKKQIEDIIDIKVVNLMSKGSY